VTDFRLDVDGVDDLTLELEGLREQYSTERVYVTGTNVEYAVYLEFGTEDMPPYPFFGPAIRGFERNPNGFIRRNTEYPSIDAIPSADALVEAVSAALAVQMTKNASAATSSGRSAGTKRDHPKRQTGNLAADISATRVR
jgi:hypothetical protein